MSTRSLTAWVTVIVLVLALPLPAHAEPRGETQARQLDDGSGEVSAGVSATAGTPGGSGSAGGGGAAGGLLHYWRVVEDPACWGEAGVTLPHGVTYEFVRHDLATGEVTVVTRRCVPPAAGDAAPAAPPAPPTLTELADLARDRIHPPPVTASPPVAFGAITGMPVHLWYDGQDQVDVAATIRGYAVTAAMRPVRWTWDTGDPRPGGVHTTTRPGSQRHPAATWTYDTKGPYTLSVHVEWAGHWTYRLDDGAGPTVTAAGALPPITLTAASAYQVDEVRSRLTGG